MTNLPQPQDRPRFAVLYGAKSTADPHLSISTQIADAAADAEARGLTVACSYSEESASAYSADRGDGLTAAMTHAERLAAEHGECWLIAQHSDRFARGDGVAARHFVEVALWGRKRGVRVHGVQDPQSGENLVMAAMMGERNHEDSKRKSLATSAGKRRNAERGDWVGGICADGYVLRAGLDKRGKRITTVEQDPERRALYQLVWDLALRSYSTAAILMEVDARGWRTLPKRNDHRARAFDVNRLQQTLENPFYAGLSTYKGEVVGKGHWKPYVSPEDFHRLQAERRARSHVEHRAPGRPPERFLIAGLAVCGVCGSPMDQVAGRKVRKDGTRARRYECRKHKEQPIGHSEHCLAMPIDAAVVDAAVLADLPALLADPDGMARGLVSGRAAERERLTREAERAQADIKECDRVLAAAAKRYDAAMAADDEAKLDLIEATQAKRRADRASAEILLAASLGALTIATEECPEEQRAAFHERLHAQLVGRLDEAREDVKRANVTLREFFDGFELTQLADGVSIAPRLSDQAAERILREGPSEAVTEKVMIGGYEAEPLPDGTFAVYVPRDEADAAEATMREQGGKFTIRTPAPRGAKNPPSSLV